MTYVPFDAGDEYDQRYRVQYLSPDTLAWVNERRFRNETDALRRMGECAKSNPDTNYRTIRIDVIDAIPAQKES